MPRFLLLLPFVVLAAVPSPADVEPPVRAAEAARVAAIEKVRPAVVAVCFYGGEACGSGVLIDPEGFALTNFHVVQPTGAVLQCGLPDGELYDSVVVGLDRVGDVALVKLLPKTPGKPFPYVKLGDSDSVRVGDWSLAMGNPFGLAIDFTPTVTYGLVSGVNRYQPPEGKGTLEYTDCIQVETSINPGNSGGPLFNMAGELIGINGRGSFDKRGRVNSGVGYAISINQIKNFLGHFRAGIDTDHATLGALVETANEDGDLSKITVKQILEESDAFRRGVMPGDQLIAFAARPLTSTNQYKNVLGIYPKEWRLPLKYRRNNDTREVLVRLMGSIDTVAGGDDEEKGKKKPAPGKPPAEKPDPNKERAKKSPAAKLFVEKKGFANYYFNTLEQDRLLAAFQKHGDFTGLTGPWAIDGTIELADRKGPVKVVISDAADGFTEVKIARNGVEDDVKPLKPDQPLGALQQPQGSGGLLVALYQYRRLLTLGRAGFEGGFSHGGHEPWYPPRADGTPPPGGLKDLRVDSEVLKTKHAAFESKWYFSLADGKLLGCEAYSASDEDPCELYFGDYRPVDGRLLPHRIDVVNGSKRYAVLTPTTYTLGKK
ncbi:MAG: S1C family serine protease [Fimbriiglobus sp.]